MANTGIWICGRESSERVITSYSIHYTKLYEAKQAQSRVKALERMEKIAPVLADAEFSFEFQEPQNLPDPMLSMVGVSIGYPPPARNNFV